jgi:hypothetical protein
VRTFSLLFWAQLVLLTSTLALLVAFGATAITGLVVPLAAEMAAVGLVGRTRAELAHAQETTGNRCLQPTDGRERTHVGQGNRPRSTGADGQLQVTGAQA